MLSAVKSDGTPELYHLSCQGPPGPSATAPPVNSYPVPQRQTTSRTAYTDRLLRWMKSTGRSVPSGFDPSKLPPNFFNMSRDELRTKMSQAAQARRQIGSWDGPVVPHKTPSAQSEVTEDTAVESNTSSPGVLSGVVASLGSVIVIMCSLGVFLFEKSYNNDCEREAVAKPGHYLDVGYDEDASYSTIDEMQEAFA
ncbi:uncharacterized protein LOC106013030 [Aplysia californica]|uniref:Uncharacterized protein LOC106013030 n=1 Tax=Aplysia californica TaxID=6500 RepID=A0ABM1A912_APLCA|nr:uncharacterized protein LOC106013030 [Aplysia californica]